jgi:hypothetical protein
MTTETRRVTTEAAPLLLTRDYDWRDDAACRSIAPDTFFPKGRGATPEEQTEAAKRVCGPCPVRTECLEWAVDTGQHTGVWGGLAEEERWGLSMGGADSFVRCLNAQDVIEARLAQGVGLRNIAAEIGVSYEVSRRAVKYFKAEHQGASA